MKSLDGKEVRVIIDDFEVNGKIIETGSKFPIISIGLGYNIEVSFNTAYKAIYMNQIIKA